MSFRAIAAAASFGLLSAACTPQAVTPSEQGAPVADQPSQPAAPEPALANAVNFQCEGGGTIDVAFDNGSPLSASASIDGGAPVTLTLDETATTSMAFRNAEVSFSIDGDRLQLTRGGETKVCTFVSRSLEAPPVEGVVRNLTEADAGVSVEMKVGDKISVSLVGVPTAGYVWSAESPPSFVAITQGPGGATSSAQFLPGFAGGNHWEVQVVEGLAPGEAEISLVQKRPWDDQAEPDDRRFRFRLKVT